MKQFRKVLAAVVALLMTVGLATPVFAASIELTNEPADYQDEHTYNVYQIFTGDVVTKTVDETTVKELQNVKYGANYGDTGASVPKAVLDGITDARAFAEGLVNADPAVLHGTIATLTKDNGFKATGLAAGYYLIVDTAAGELAEGDVYSQYIVQVLDDVTIDTKKDVPSSDKKITADEHPATEGGDANPGVSSDGKTDNVSVGDKVTFEITAKVPAHADDYDFYYFIINDTLSAGLTLDPNSITVTTDKDADEDGNGDTLIKDTDYKVYTGTDVTPVEEGQTPHTFEVALLNAKAHKGETIKVTYQATLNENAVIGGTGNLNTETLTYSNNPNKKYDGTQDENKPGKPDSTKEVPVGETPDSTTKTYTSGIKLQKIDQDGMALAGAKFTIEGDSINKVVKNTEVFAEDAEGDYWKLKTGAYTDEAPQTEDQMVAAPAGATDGYVLWLEGDEEEKVTVGGKDYRVVRSGETPTHILKKKNSELYDSPTTKYKKTTTESVEETTDHVSQELEVNADGTLEFKGLGAGTYTIKETVVPQGYNKAQDTTVVITFNNTTKTFTATVNGTAVTADSVTNLFPVDVMNVAGNVLPTTGGMGTTLFYIVGTLFVLGAGIVLVSKRRMAE
ncbi:MAG: isopeptide-forming domain-containing fimbrial protein [Solobacterium sp.]|nr:isopeptide-forming domain-containing fimbrial protein [Solobacterium sp.]